MNLISKAHIQDYFQSHNCLKLSFMNIKIHFPNFVDHESFHKSISLDMLASCETDLEDSFDCSNYSRKGYLRLIHSILLLMHYSVCLADYMKERLLFACDTSPKN